tara:strand:- start:6795 stop:7142 length:348 start_codon:yes stop_codon:yes gene_type:complete
MIKINFKIFLALNIVVSLIFALAGLSKIFGIEMMHDSFITLGLPIWFGYFIGFCEFFGSIGLQIKKLRLYACLGLTIIMLGAINYHLKYENDGLVASIVITALCLLILISKEKEN